MTSSWNQASIDSDNGLTPYGRQAIIWIKDDLEFTEARMRHSASISLKFRFRMLNQPEPVHKFASDSLAPNDAKSSVDTPLITRFLLIFFGIGWFRKRFIA